MDIHPCYIPTMSIYKPGQIVHQAYLDNSFRYLFLIKRMEPPTYWTESKEIWWAMDLRDGWECGYRLDGSAYKVKVINDV